MTRPRRRAGTPPSSGGGPPPAPPDRVLDTRGLLCPLPIVETAEAVARMSPGQVLQVLSDDFGVLADMPAWCKGTGHELLGIREEGDLVLCWVRRAR